MSFSISFYHRVIWSLTTLLLLTIGPAYSEWVQVASLTTRGGFSVYADLDTVRRKGELVKMWVLFDFGAPQDTGQGAYLSWKAQGQFDCAEERARMVDLVYFASNMGAGNVVHNDSDGFKWAPVPPRSGTEVLWKVACKTK